MGKTTVWVVSFENRLYWKAISKEMTTWLDLDLENSFGVEKLASLVDQKIANLLSKIENIKENCQENDFIVKTSIKTVMRMMIRAGEL